MSPKRCCSSLSVALRPQSLGVLDLQPLVDHLAQDLGSHTLAQVGTVLQVGGADGEQDPLRQIEIGDGIVVDARDHAQPFSRCECRRQHDDDGEESAEEQRRH